MRKNKTPTYELGKDYNSYSIIGKRLIKLNNLNTKGRRLALGQILFIKFEPATVFKCSVFRISGTTIFVKDIDE